MNFLNLTTDQVVRFRKSSRWQICTVVVVALVMTACGGRAADDESAKGRATATEEPERSSPAQPATEPEPAAPAPDATGDVAAPPAAPAAPTPPTAAPAPKAAASSGAKAASPAPAAGAAPKPPKPSGKRTSAAAGEPGAVAPPAPPPAVPAPAPAPPGGGRHTGPANLSPIHLGTICECSGPTGASIGAGLVSNQIVVKWINDNGGLNGHPIKLFVADSNSDPNRYFALVKRMVEQDGVVAFIGQMSPLTINAGDKYLREKGIPVIGGDGAHGLWFESPMLFFAGPSYKTMAVATAKHAVTLGTPKIAMFYCAEAQPCQIGRDALHSQLRKEKAPEASIVYEAKVSLAQPDFTAECLQAQSKGAEAVILFVDAAAASRATRSCIQQGYRPQWLTSPLTSADAKDPNNEGMANPVAVFPWFLEETPAQKLYHETVRRYKPDLVPTATTSVVWVAGQILLEATRDLPAENPTSQDILRGLWAIQGRPLDGLISEPVSFAENQPSRDSLCYFMVQIKDRAYVAPLGNKTQCL